MKVSRLETIYWAIRYNIDNAWWHRHSKQKMEYLRVKFRLDRRRCADCGNRYRAAEPFAIINDCVCALREMLKGK